MKKIAFYLVLGAVAFIATYGAPVNNSPQLDSPYDALVDLENITDTSKPFPLPSPPVAGDEDHILVFDENPNSIDEVVKSENSTRTSLRNFIGDDDESTEASGKTTDYEIVIPEYFDPDAWRQFKMENGGRTAESDYTTDDDELTEASGKTTDYEIVIPEYLDPDAWRQFEMENGGRTAESDYTTVFEESKESSGKPIDYEIVIPEYLDPDSWRQFKMENGGRTVESDYTTDDDDSTESSGKTTDYEIVIPEYLDPDSWHKFKMENGGRTAESDYTTDDDESTESSGKTTDYEIVIPEKRYNEGGYEIIPPCYILNKSANHRKDPRFIGIEPPTFEKFIPDTPMELKNFIDHYFRKQASRPLCIMTSDFRTSVKAFTDLTLNNWKYYTTDDDESNDASGETPDYQDVYPEYENSDVWSEFNFENGGRIEPEKFYNKGGYEIVLPCYILSESANNDTDTQFVGRLIERPIIPMKFTSNTPMKLKNFLNEYFRKEVSRTLCIKTQDFSKSVNKFIDLTVHNYYGHNEENEDFEKEENWISSPETDIESPEKFYNEGGYEIVPPCYILNKSANNDKDTRFVGRLIEPPTIPMKFTSNTPMKLKKFINDYFRKEVSRLLCIKTQDFRNSVNEFIDLTVHNYYEENEDFEKEENWISSPETDVESPEDDEEGGSGGSGSLLLEENQLEKFYNKGGYEIVPPCYIFNKSANHYRNPRFVGRLIQPPTFKKFILDTPIKLKDFIYDYFRKEASRLICIRTNDFRKSVNAFTDFTVDYLFQLIHLTPHQREMLKLPRPYVETADDYTETESWVEIEPVSEQLDDATTEKPKVFICGVRPVKHESVERVESDVTDVSNRGDVVDEVEPVESDMNELSDLVDVAPAYVEPVDVEPADVDDRPIYTNLYVYSMFEEAGVDVEEDNVADAKDQNPPAPEVQLDNGEVLMKIHKTINKIEDELEEVEMKNLPDIQITVNIDEPEEDDKEFPALLIFFVLIVTFIFVLIMAVTLGIHVTKRWNNPDEKRPKLRLFLTVYVITLVFCLAAYIPCFAYLLSPGIFDIVTAQLHQFLK